MSLPPNRPALGRAGKMSFVETEVRKDVHGKALPASVAGCICRTKQEGIRKPRVVDVETAGVNTDWFDSGTDTAKLERASAAVAAQRDFSS